MAELAITFKCGADDLVGILHRPQDTDLRTGILVVVGGPQYRVGSHRQFVIMARSFAAAGYPVFRFDYRGMGDSTGRSRKFDSIDDDIRSAMDQFFLQVPELTGAIIFGLCDAASAALMYGPQDLRLKGLILANPWVRTEAGEAKAYLRHYYIQRLLQWSFWRKLLAGEFRVSESVRGLRGFWLRSRGAGGSTTGDVVPSFIDEMRRGLNGAMCPVLILISERDLTAREFTDLCRESPAWAQAIADARVRWATLRDADHTFSSAATLVLATTTCLQWINALPRE